MQSLENTPLELFTLAIVIYTLVSFSFWWHKRKDVEQAYVVHIDAVEITEAGLMPELKSTYDALWLLHTLIDNIRHGVEANRSRPKSIIFVHTFAVLAFGGCHLLARNYSFVNSTKQWLWRVYSQACLVTAVIFQLVTTTDKPRVRIPKIVIGITYGLLIFLTIIIRSCLFVEMFVALRWVPASVHQDVNWQLYIPHL